MPLLPTTSDSPQMGDSVHQLRKWNCEECHDTGILGDEGPGRHGSRDYALLDLYCCAGGAGEGYRLAGFDVLGVDILPQPKNPHKFVQGCALEYLREHGHKYDLIHASPPCQAYTKAGKQWRKEGREYVDLIEATREALIANGKPWIIENVPGAPLRNPIFLNGSAFGIRVHRPRYFETSFPLAQPEVPPMKPVKMGRPIKEGDIV